MNSSCGAILDPVGDYRYRLWRIWDASRSPVVFVMLNPSTADADRDDPTIRRCTGYARDWGAGGLVVVNLFAWRATRPAELCRVRDPVGPENDDHIRDVCSGSCRVVIAWGNYGVLHSREAAVLERLAGRQLLCLGQTAAGHPLHPLRQRRELRPVAYRSVRVVSVAAASPL